MIISYLLDNPYYFKFYLYYINHQSVYVAVNSQIVWGYLEECDIFGAAKVVVQSKLLLEACSYGSEVTVSSLSFPTFFSASALKVCY
jgi:hypothetical protein